MGRGANTATDVLFGQLSRDQAAERERMAAREREELDQSQREDVLLRTVFQMTSVPDAYILGMSPQQLAFKYTSFSASKEQEKAEAERVFELMTQLKDQGYLVISDGSNEDGIYTYFQLTPEGERFGRQLEEAEEKRWQAEQDSKNSDKQAA